MPYNINQIVTYDDDVSYRKQIRDVFSMNCSPISDYDAVTNDELMYEDDAMTKSLDEIYAMTKDVPDFIHIYTTTAGFMLSTDPNIGLAVVFSYDYFDKFHPCLVDFLRSGSISAGNREVLNLTIN
jgi:hypothetical protein